MRKTKLCMLGLFLALITQFAFAQKKLTPEIIDLNGTKIFNVAKDTLLTVAQSVFTENGYKILLVNESKGLIKTDRKYIKSIAQAVGYDQAQQVDCYRQYLITATEVDATHTKIVLTPKLYMGQTDISDNKVWVIKGDDGEIKLWESLFKNFDEYIK